MYLLNIPLQIQYESTGTSRFYATAGVKAGLVADSKYKSSIDMDLEQYVDEVRTLASD